ncbi:MAG: hypothetical protein KIS85_00445 [Anaerolineales bacterium]|nr:hypothetical protein [Anaerolineales bacterium]
MAPRIFLEPEAEYFCSNFAALGGDALLPLEDFLANKVTRKKISEGSALFNDLRDSWLREIQRLLFLAASQYVRSHDLLLTSSAYWAHVTMYYGTWYAAKALLGMFGCHIRSRDVFEVERGDQGFQTITKTQIGNGPTQIFVPHGGSHQRFWHLFYSATPPIASLLEPRLSVALSGVLGNTMWLISERNDVNYKTDISFRAITQFQGSFDPNNFPASLRGTLATQYRILDLLLEVAFLFAHRFSLNTDSLSALNAGSTFGERIEQLVVNGIVPNNLNKRLLPHLTQ